MEEEGGYGRTSAGARRVRGEGRRDDADDDGRTRCVGRAPWRRLLRQPDAVDGRAASSNVPAVGRLVRPPSGRARRLAGARRATDRRRPAAARRRLVLGDGAGPGDVRADARPLGDRRPALPGRRAPRRRALRRAERRRRRAGVAVRPAVVRGVPDRARHVRTQRLHLRPRRAVRPRACGRTRPRRRATVRRRRRVAASTASALRHRNRKSVRPAPRDAVGRRTAGAEQSALRLPCDSRNSAADAGVRQRRRGRGVDGRPLARLSVRPLGPQTTDSGRPASGQLSRLRPRSPVRCDCGTHSCSVSWKRQ